MLKYNSIVHFMLYATVILWTFWIKRCTWIWYSNRCLRWCRYAKLRNKVAHLDQVGAHCSDERGVVFSHWREAHSEFCLAVPGPLKDDVGLLAPRNKEAVILHAGHHLVHLLHGKPAHKIIQMVMFKLALNWELACFYTCVTISERFLTPLHSSLIHCKSFS